MKAGAKVQPNTLFEIGSISKSFVALALMQMREEGKFDPSQPITTYLPWLKIDSKYAPITGHHLLSHTSGLPDGVPLELIGPDQPLWTGFAPGEHFAYSNVGYDLLGHVLEAIDRQPLAAVLRRRVLDPLGMSSSEPVITNAIRPRMAIGYAPMFDDRPFPLRGTLAEAPWVEFGEGAGSVSSTATDMGTYLTMLINRGKGKQRSIITPESFAKLISPVIKAPFWGEDASYGYGLWTSEAEAARCCVIRAAWSRLVRPCTLTSPAASARSRQSTRTSPVIGRTWSRSMRSIFCAQRSRERLFPQRPRQTRHRIKFLTRLTLPERLLQPTEQSSCLPQTETSCSSRFGNQRVALESAGPNRFFVKHPDFELFLLEVSTRSQRRRRSVS